MCAVPDIRSLSESEDNNWLEYVDGAGSFQVVRLASKQVVSCTVDGELSVQVRSLHSC